MDGVAGTLHRTGRGVGRHRRRAARADSDIDALLAEWRFLTETMQQWMRENDPPPMGDVVIHEQDLRGALGVPGALDNAALTSLFATLAGMCETTP